MAINDLFEQLKDAILAGDSEQVEKLRRKILNTGRDEEIDAKFLAAIKGKTIYRNMLYAIYGGGDMQDLDYAKMISSLITHCFIECQQTGNSLDDYPIKELYIVLGEFVNGDMFQAVSKSKQFLEDRYAGLISDD